MRKIHFRKLLRNSLFAAVALITLAPLNASAEAGCEEIIETGPYPYNGYFTKGPGYAGCYTGKVVGGVIGLPFTIIYAPIVALTDSEDDDTCCKAGSPIRDSAEFFGRVFGYALGAPFMFIESIFTSDYDKGEEDAADR